MTKSIRQRRHKQKKQLKQRKVPKNAFTKDKDIDLREHIDNAYLWAITHILTLYDCLRDKNEKKLSKKTIESIKKDQEKRAEFLAKIFKSGKYNSLKLLDGDGRMLAQIIIAFYRHGLTLPNITVAETDKKRYIYHCNNFPTCVNKEYGDIFSTAVDKNTFIYYNFCSIGSIVNQGNFMKRLEKTENYMIGFTSEGTKKGKSVTGIKREKTELSKVINTMRKMQFVSKRGGFYETRAK